MIYVTDANYSENKVLMKSLFYVSLFSRRLFQFFQNLDEFFFHSVKKCKSGRKKTFFRIYFASFFAPKFISLKISDYFRNVAEIFGIFAEFPTF